MSRGADELGGGVKMKKRAVLLAVLSLTVALSILVQADSIQAWGDNTVSQLDAPAGDDFAAIACGNSRWG